MDGTSAASYVLRRLPQFDHDPDDELWMLLDTDHCAQGTHLAGFVDALREARRQGVNVALSKPSFELNCGYSYTTWRKLHWVCCRLRRMWRRHCGPSSGNTTRRTLSESIIR